jgi:hypothetical protein
MPTYKPREVSPAGVRALADELVAAAGALTALATSMEESEFKTLRVPCYEQMERSIAFANRFAAAVKQAILAAKADRGDYLGSEGGKVKRLSIR